MRERLSGAGSWRARAGPGCGSGRGGWWAGPANLAQMPANGSGTAANLAQMPANGSDTKLRKEDMETFKVPISVGLCCFHQSKF